MRVREPLGAIQQGGAVALRPDDGGRPTWRAWIGLGGMVLTAFVITLSASHTRLLLPQSLRALPESLRPVPRWVAGLFESVSLDIGTVGIIVVLSLMFICYALAVRAKRLSRRAVLTSIGLLNGLVLVAPPLLSTDLFSYIAYGRLGATYGINPYLYGPNVISFDHIYHFVGTQWRYTPTAYGPLFTALSYPLSELGIAAN
ncbi:MAG: hypothetical protein ACRDL8_07055, partial [Solirubrobacteraceae bacterium]